MYDYLIRANKIYTMDETNPEIEWVTVQDRKIAEVGKGAIHDTRRVDVKTALKYYTVNPAYAAHEENERGKISAGYFADFTVLDRNPYEEPKHINEFQVKATFTEGNLVYKNK